MKYSKCGTDEDFHALRVIELSNFMDTLDVDVVGAVDGLGDAIKGVRSGLASSEGRVVFNVVEPGMLLAVAYHDEAATSHERRVVQQADDVLDVLEGAQGDVEPVIEDIEQLASVILGGKRVDVAVRSIADL
jgi:hypothetical protein